VAVGVEVSVLPRLLFWTNVVLAGSLAVLVMFCPLLDDGRSRLLGLFAHDVVLRRTALAASVGLLATAFVFFRPANGRTRRAPPRGGVS
jgi:hypothetical protein